MRTRSTSCPSPTTGPRTSREVTSICRLHRIHHTWYDSASRARVPSVVRVASGSTLRPMGTSSFGADTGSSGEIGNRTPVRRPLGLTTSNRETKGFIRTSIITSRSTFPSSPPAPSPSTPLTPLFRISRPTRSQRLEGRGHPYIISTFARGSRSTMSCFRSTHSPSARSSPSSWGRIRSDGASNWKESGAWDTTSSISPL